MRPVPVSPELVRSSLPLDRLADVLSERAFVTADPDLSDGPACVRAAFGAPVGGAGRRPGDTSGRIRRCGERRRGSDATLLAACWETADLARRHADHVALAHRELRAADPVGTGKAVVTTRARPAFPTETLLGLVRRGFAALWSWGALLRPSPELTGRLIRGALLAGGAVAGARWALPLQEVEGRCPPSGEGYGYCYLQKSVLPAVILVLGPIIGAQLLGTFLTLTAPDLRRRWKAGERPTRMTSRQAAAPYSEDPVLLAASWGVRTGAED